MKIISITGTASDAGKTTVVSFILKELLDRTYSYAAKKRQIADERTGNKYEFSKYKPEWGALKITVRHEGACPRHTDCDTCDSENEPYKILTSDNIIKEKGKDTDLLSRAGANKVVWLQTDSKAEKVGLEAALSCFDKEHAIIVEGNSFLRVRNANVAILVASPSVKKIKKSAKFLVNKNKIDFVAINVTAKHTPEQIEECRDQLRIITRNVPDFIINPFVEDSFSNQAFIDKIQECLGFSTIGC